ncbi:hypothetical protein HHK36_000467 [Tetracentron sinense]|uniref:Uncharacterized protein n=1 Tax=Tetracentron sinense TaxID=13715 RepID=A0A835DU15_TETSI|nr:hypothetical protein HHK36_000467 [Tetracentron sinense]
MRLFWTRLHLQGLLLRTPTECARPRTHHGEHYASVFFQQSLMYLPQGLGLGLLHFGNFPPILPNSMDPKFHFVQRGSCDQKRMLQLYIIQLFQAEGVQGQKHGGSKSRFRPIHAECLFAGGSIFVNSSLGGLTADVLPTLDPNCTSGEENSWIVISWVKMKL